MDNTILLTMSALVLATLVTVALSVLLSVLLGALRSGIEWPVPAEYAHSPAHVVWLAPGVVDCETTDRQILLLTLRTHTARCGVLTFGGMSCKLS